MLVGMARKFDSVSQEIGEARGSKSHRQPQIIFIFQRIKVDPQVASGRIQGTTWSPPRPGSRRQDFTLRKSSTSSLMPFPFLATRCQMRSSSINASSVSRALTSLPSRMSAAKSRLSL